MKIATIVLSMLLFAAAATAETPTQFVEQLKATDINFIYSSEGRLIFIKTKETADDVDAILSEVPAGLSVRVIEYLDKGKEGTELRENGELLEPAVQEVVTQPVIEEVDAE